MESVAAQFSKKVLREVDEKEFFAKIPELREAVGDRAVLRAIHFYKDNARVLREVDALKKNDFEKFKQLVIESGDSSYMYNQNVFATKQPEIQPVSIARENDPPRLREHSNRKGQQRPLHSLSILLLQYFRHFWKLLLYLHYDSFLIYL